MPRLRVPEQIGTFEHARYGLDRRGVQWDDAMARLVLAPSDVQQPLDEIHVAPANVLHLHRTHRRVGSDDYGSVDVLPLRIRGGDVEQAPPLLAGQRFSWAVDATYTPGSGEAHSVVLDEIYQRAYSVPESLGNIAEYSLCLGYAAFAVIDMVGIADLHRIGAPPIGVAVGFDSGDGLLLGNLTAGGFVPISATS